MDETMSLGASWSADMPWNPLRSLRRRYRERQTDMALLALDDTQLKDFGIDCGAIPWSVRRLHLER